MHRPIITEGFLPTPRTVIELYKAMMLSDAEYVLYYSLLLLAGWDEKKHPESYGRCDITYDSIKKDILPLWSKGKISTYMNKLIHRGLIIQEGRSVYRVVDYDRYSRSKQIQQKKLEKAGTHPLRQNITKAEPKVKSREQKIPRPEQFVQPAEQIQPVSNYQGTEKMRKALANYHTSRLHDP